MTGFATALYEGREAVCVCGWERSAQNLAAIKRHESHWAWEMTVHVPADLAAKVLR